MTEDKEEDNVLCAIRTVKGNHAINQYNQREIDVVRDEVLPILKSMIVSELLLHTIIK